MVRSPSCQQPGEYELSSLATNLFLAADGEGFHTPSIAEFFPPAIWFEGTPFEINRIILVRLLVVVVLCALMVLAARRARIVPGRWQSLVEVGLDFVRKSIAQEILGKEAKRFVPMLTTLFFAIFAFNLTGVLPFLNIASTSLVGMPLVLAVWVYITYLAIGVKRHGLGGYLRNALMPPGVPKALYLMLTPLEILQVFVLRPVTLALRLTANMIAGHLILILCFAASHYFLFEATGALKGLTAFSVTAGVAFTLFKAGVALLQAYIFTLLSALYLNMALEEEH